MHGTSLEETMSPVGDKTIMNNYRNNRWPLIWQVSETHLDTFYTFDTSLVVDGTGASTQSRETKYIPRRPTQQEIAKLYRKRIKHTKWKVIHLRITRYLEFAN